MLDEEYMKMALELAKKGEGFVAPNPMVGAIVVKDGEIIGNGYHEKYGEKHAERNALLSCVKSPVGSTMYVTLEPCCHHGKQPPCVDAILEAGISKVVIGSLDPNPLVSGKGVRILQEQGVKVITNVLKDECDKLNEDFFYYIRTGNPFVTMKYAMTMDGKIAAHTGLSKWITGESAREHVHKQRKRNQAIMVGVGTVLADNPLLNCRMENGRNPIRIICDTKLRTPIDSNIVNTANEIPTLLATCCNESEKWDKYINKGCQIVHIDEKDGVVDLKKLVITLGRMEISSIMLEGGSQLNWSALHEGIVQKVHTYIAPKLLGGMKAKSPVEGIGFSSPDESVRLNISNIVRLGEDFLIESEVESSVYWNN